MFNPKQALQRIRKTRQQKSQDTSVHNDSPNSRSLFPQNQQALTQSYQKIQKYQQPINYSTRSKPSPSFQHPFTYSKISNQSLQDRMQKLQSLVTELSQKLTQSNQTIEQLKQQNNQLQTHVLKLQSQNSQLKTSQKYSQLKHSLSSKINGINVNGNSSALSENNKLLSSLQNQKNLIRKIESKIIEEEVFSPEVQDAMEEIKKQHITNILKRKQHNFRALKNASKDSLLKGQKALKQLANLHKSHGKHYKKPTLIINLEDTDFQ